MAIAALMILSIPLAMAQRFFPQKSDTLTIRGIVVDSVGTPIDNALVRLEKKDIAGSVEIRTNAAGRFSFPATKNGSYTISAEKSGLRGRIAVVTGAPHDDQQSIHLVLEESAGVHSDPNSSAASSTQAIEFADKPDFTIAGVTDWTAAGGHGSDSSLRTSEALVRETVTLAPVTSAEGAADSGSFGSGPIESESKLHEALANSPGSAEANHRLGVFYLHAGRYSEAIPLLQASHRIDPGNHVDAYDLALAFKGAGDYVRTREYVQGLLAHWETGDLHRLAAELDEKQGDPLAAVHEYEQAARMDPNEQNYFEWGSDLLMHRAVWQALEVFQQGVKAFPKSTRMLSALGAALFAGARYDEAALRFCDASELNPADTEPYIFMGKIEMASLTPLPCIEQKLRRFVEMQPENATANYLYAMALWKEQGKSADLGVTQQVESLLTKAVTIDVNCSDAYLQLGILFNARRNYEKAIGYYKKAIEITPRLGEAHYRLGIAYDRVGELEMARKEFQLHDEIKKTEAAAVEQQRREVKQFLVVGKGQPGNPVAH